MDIIANNDFAGGSGGRRGSRARRYSRGNMEDNTMGNNSFEGEYDDEQASSQDSGDKYSANDEQRRAGKQRKLIEGTKRNIGQFFTEYTIGDLLPHNQKLVVLNHEMTITQTIEAMIRQQNVRSAVIWNK